MTAPRRPARASRTAAPRPATLARDAAPSGSPAPPGRLETALVLGLALAYAAFFSGLCTIKYQTFLYTDFDLAIFTQATDGILRGTLHSSIRGMPWLGDHASLILFLVAPLFALARHPLTLLVLQSTALAAGAIPVWRFARRELAPGAPAVMCAALYLLQPALGYLNLFEFHPEALAVPFVLAAIEGAWAGAVLRTLVCAGIALLAREDVAIAMLGLAAAAALARRPRANVLATALAGIAVAVLVFDLGVLRPRLSAGAAEYGRMYAAWGDSPGAMLGAIVRDPFRALGALFETAGDPGDGALKRLYWVHLLLPLAALPLLAPLLALPALPIAAEHLLSSRPPQHSIVFQYAALVLPFLVMAAVRGAGWLTRRRARPALVLSAIALAAALAGQVLFGPIANLGVMPGIARPQALRPSSEDRTLLAARARMLARVPREGGVVASYEFLPHLATRPDVHSLHHVLSGRYTYSQKPYPVPRTTVAMIADLGRSSLFHQVDGGTAERLRALRAPHALAPVDADADVVLELAAPADTVELVTPGVTPAGPPRRAVYDGQLALVGTGIEGERVAAGGSLAFAVDWVKVAPVERLFLTEFVVVDTAGRFALQRWRYLGYLRAPVAAWTPGQVVRERYRLPIPRVLPPGRYQLGVRPWSRGGGTTLVSRTDDPAALAASAFSLVGRFTVDAPASP